MIPPAARITAFADAYEVTTADCVSRVRLPEPESLTRLEESAIAHFDSDVMGALRELAWADQWRGVELERIRFRERIEGAMARAGRCANGLLPE